jgi:hypothetical protein
VLNEQFENLSLPDPLTRLLNRHATNQLVPSVVGRASRNNRNLTFVPPPLLRTGRTSSTAELGLELDRRKEAMKCHLSGPFAAPVMGSEYADTLRTAERRRVHRKHRLGAGILIFVARFLPRALQVLRQCHL